MKRTWVVVGMCLLAVGALAADTKPVKNLDGNCMAMVPSTWSVDTLGGAQSPDKKVSIVVSSPKHGLTSLSQVKQLTPGIYPKDKVTRDSGTEFVMEGESLNGKPNVYRAVAAGDKVCIAEVQYQNGDAAAAKAIADSLKSSK